MEHGALAYTECLADDAPTGGMTSCSPSVLLKKGGTVVFPWIKYKSRAHRGRICAAVMKDPRIQAMLAAKHRPFDRKRMICGGFTQLLAR